MKPLNVMVFCETCRKETLHSPAKITHQGPHPGEWTGTSRCQECGEVSTAPVTVYPVY